MSLKEELYKLYWEDKLTQKEIGKIYNKSQRWVSSQMNKCNMPTRKNRDIKTRFLSYVKIPENVNDCWEWVGSKHSQGYGHFQFNGKPMAAHRMSYTLYVGELEPISFCLHKCDNPGCVNPNHLFLGNNKENMEDMKQKSRQAKGEKVGNSKLTEADVKRIKELLLQGKSCVKVGILFKVSHVTISNIKQGRTWIHVTS